MLERISIEAINRFSCLIIGKAGIGKTSLINTILGKTFNQKTKQWDGEFNKEEIYILSAESGLVAVSDAVTSGLLQGFEIKSMEDVGGAYQKLAFIPNDDKKVGWIFIDSLTEIADICEYNLKKKYKDKKDNWGMWGDYADIMLDILKKFRSLTNYNVIITCLETIDKDQNNCRYAAPEVSGKKLPNRLVSLFDEVFYMTKTANEKGEEKVVFLTSASQFYPGKDRSGKLNEVEETNLLSIRNKIINKE